MAILTKNMEAILKAASLNLKLSFSNTTSTTILTTPGQQVTSQASQSTPTLSLRLPPSISTSASASDISKKRFICLSLDPDAPFPSFPFLAPILHGIQTDLRVSDNPPALTDPDGDADGDSEAWVTLTANDSPPIVAWIPPAPPKFSATHRYLFLLWEQPEGLAATKIRQDMGWGERERVSRVARMRWDQGAFERRYRLGECVAGN